jgi:hypothetical protein
VDRILLPLAHWALRRYAFDLAKKLQHACLEGRARTLNWFLLKYRGFDGTAAEATPPLPKPENRWLAFRLQRFLLPRLFCAVALGMFALTTQTVCIEMGLWMTLHGWTLAAAWPGAGLALWFMLAWEVRQRAPQTSEFKLAMLKILLTGLGYGVLLAGLAVSLHLKVANPATSQGRALIDAGPCTLGALALSLAIFGFLLGYSLQLFWDDKSISDSF